jgi:hypothetical protein
LPFELPATFAVFNRRVSGDESLLRLGQAEFERAGLGAEIYPAGLQDALWTWSFVPRTSSRHFVHLPRHWDPRSREDRQELLRMAHGLRGRARGLVLHDRLDWGKESAEVLSALGEIDRSLAADPEQPWLHLEYAAGLDLDLYCRLLEAAQGLRRVSACIDIGHVAIFSAKRWLEQRHPNLDPFTMAPDSAELPALVADLANAAAKARQDLVAFVCRVSSLGKPVHFHLHDANPLWQGSLYGLRDHLKFGQQVSVPETLSPTGIFPNLLGTEGLAAALAAAIAELPTSKLTLTLEIHPTKELRRKPLGENAQLFSHWTDLTHAEITNYWVATLVEQHALLLDVLRSLDVSAVGV